MNDIEAVATRLAEAGITTVEVATPDCHAHMRGKRVPVKRFVESIAAGSINMADAIYVLDFENDLADSPYINMGTGFLDCSLVPDLETLRILTYRPGYALVFADSYDENREMHPLSPRTVLRGQVEACAKAGYEILAATEMEAYLFTPEWEPIQTHVQYSSLTADLDVELMLLAIREALAGAGIEVEGSNLEYGPGQVEVNTGPTDPVTCADNTMLFKSIVRHIAERHGLRASFMAKPWAEHGGSGMHTHTSLKAADGSNAFASSDGTPNELMGHWVAGLLRHGPSMALIGSPTPNGYKRIREYTFAPTHIHWGLDNRTVLARCICERGSGANRVEYRSGGADANPYLMLAGLLAAGLDGIEQKYTLPEMGVGDKYADPGDAAPLPVEMSVALENFRNSPMAALLGEKFSTHYVILTEMELTKYLDSAGAPDANTVTDWERARYLPTA